MRLLDEKGTSIPFQVEEYSEWFSRAVTWYSSPGRAFAGLQDVLSGARG